MKNQFNMKVEKNRKLISEMKEALNPKKEKQGLIESLVFGDGADNYEMDDPGFDAGNDFEDTPDNGEDTPKEEDQTVKEPGVKSIIDNIRKLSLQGIQQMYNDPSSVEYDTLKKIWQLCDKAVDSKQPEMKAKNNNI